MKPGRVSPKIDYRNFRSVPVNKPRSSVINGAEMVTRHSKEYSEGWERIFGGGKSAGGLVENGTSKIPEGRATRYVFLNDALRELYAPQDAGDMVVRPRELDPMIEQVLREVATSALKGSGET